MSDIDKKRFHEMAEKNKKRFDTEMQNYTPPKEENKGRDKTQTHQGSQASQEIAVSSV